MQINWRDPNQWTVNTNAEWDEKKQALKFTGYHNSWLKKPIIIDPNKHYQISVSIYCEEAGSSNLYLGGNVCNKQRQRVTSNYLYTLCCSQPYQQFLNKWTTFNAVHYGTQPIVSGTRYNFETTGWVGDTTDQSVTDKMTYFYYFGGLFNYSSQTQGIMYIKDIKIVILDEDDSNCTFSNEGVYIEKETNNLYTNPIINIYNNFGVPASITKLNESYNKQPIYRLQMTVDDQHQNRLNHFRNVLWDHGIMISPKSTFLANTKYCNSIFWRPVNKKDIYVGGLASNINNWYDGGTTKNADGWFRTTQYRDGGVTTDKSDYTFWSFKCPSLELNETVYIDFCCPQLESGSIYQNQYTSTNRGNGTLQLPAELFPQQNGTIICNAKLNQDSEAKIFDNATNTNGNNIKLTPNGTVCFNQGGIESSTSVSNINQFHNYAYVIRTENGTTTVSLFIDGIKKATINNQIYQNRSFFSLGKEVNGSCLSSITIKDFSIYERQLFDSEIAKLAKNSQTITKAGNIIGVVQEKENLLQPPYTVDLWNNENNGDAITYYTQINCIVRKEERSSAFNKYCYLIYRPSNLIYQGNRSIVCSMNAGTNIVSLQSGTTQDLNVGDQILGYGGDRLITEITDTTSFKVSSNFTATYNNVTVTVRSTTMYGGLVVKPPEESKQIGKTYRLSFKAKGQSSNILRSYFEFSVGWGSYGMGLQSHTVFNEQYPPQDFISKEWKHFQCFYTVETNRFMNGTIYLSTTQGSKIAQIKSGYYANMQIGEVLKDNPNLQSDTAVAAIPNYQTTIELSKEAIQTGTEVLTRTTKYYDTYRQFKIGFNYSSTGQLGTKLFIDDIKIEEVTNSKKYFSIQSNITTTKFRESINKIYALGSSAKITSVEFDPNIPREFSLNRVQTTPASGRGLTLITFNKNCDILSNQCFDIYSLGTNIDDFILQMQQINNQTYWCLMSYDACRTNEQLINYMKEIKANKFSEHDWNTEPQTPYVQVGKGQNCLKEELVKNNKFVWYATITYYF